MKSNALHVKVLPSLLGGTSRHPLPAGSGGAPEMLSLVGQALRFDRPARPDSFLVEPEIYDDRKIMPDRLRRPLIRVLTSKSATEHPARALARAFDALRVRPHPFDLPLLDAFIRAYAEKLGATAQHWADRQKPGAATQSYFDPESLNDSNWAQATLSRRTAYLEERRQIDADAARALVESTWAQEDADARFRLLQVFQSGLGIADQPFLNSLEKDRAPRVRTLAARFLARLGAGSTNPALSACMERIQPNRKRTTLRLELPANVQEQAASRWILQTFTDVSFGELAGAFGMGEKELIDAAEKDESLLLALALMATYERRLDLLEQVVASLPNAWQRMFEAGLDTLGAMTEAECHRWEEILVHPYRKEVPANYALWDWLHRIADAQASLTVMEIVLRSKLLTEIAGLEQGIAPWLEVIAALCPTSHRQGLREQLTGFDPSHTVIPLALLEILDGMENHDHHV